MIDHTTLTLACCTTAHYVIAMVMFVYARHQVKYLSIAWIMALFAFALTFFCFHWGVGEATQGIMQPAALLALVCISYLQSIYPLSFVMPGYLQWRRMLWYAAPIIALIVLYGGAMLLGFRPLALGAPAQLWQNILHPDVWARLATVVLSGAYIVNIFRLPHRLTHVEFPRYLVGYSVMLGLNSVFYAVVCIISFHLPLVLTYTCIFTLINLYLCMRTLETMALQLPRPAITQVKNPPTQEQIDQARHDFNEANRILFERLEYWMQHNRQAWQDNTFGRDRLCQCTGINRHLTLQCLRSQGYNNIHDYLLRYRVDEIKRMVISGQVRTVAEAQVAGFGTNKTARNCFLKVEGVSLDEFIERHGR